MPMTPKTFAPGEVPSTFAPDVAQGDMPMVPASSPWVSPMKNSAPSLLSQTGAVLTQTGDTEAKLGNTIADRVQEAMDSAQAQAAQTQFLGAALPVLSQYRSTQGMAATQQYDTAGQAIVKARQDARATLTNPIQQRAFDLATNDHMLTFAQQMAAHESDQRIQYGKQQASDSADSMNALGRMAYLNGNMDDYQKYSQQADSDTLNMAQLNGAAPDSDVAQAMLRAKRSDLARGIVSGLLEKKAVNEADQYFSSVQGNLDMRTAEALDSSIKGMHMQEDPKVFGQQAIMAAKGITGPGVLQPPIPAGTITTTDGVDGIDIHAAPGTKVLAPGSGTVTKVWIGPNVGRSAQITLPNGYTATFNGLAAVNYTEGQKITQGQALGLSGQDDNGRAVTHYGMTGPDGATVDPRQASSSPMDPKTFSSPQDEEKAIDWIPNNVSDPDMQKLTEGYVRYVANTNRGIENQEHAGAVKDATNYAVQHGGSIEGLPAATRSLLTPEDIDSFTQQVRAKNDVNLLANWIQNPDQMSVNAVTLAHQQGRLSDSGYLTALRQATQLQYDAQNPDPQKVLAATVDNEQFENTLNQNGHADIVNAKPAEAKPGATLTPAQQTANQLVAQRVALQSEIKDQIDAEQQVSRSPLTRAQKQSIIDSTLLNSQFLKAPGWVGGAAPWQLTPAAAGVAQYTSSTGATVPYAPMPPAMRPAVIQSLIQRRQPVNEQNIYDTWVNSGMPGARRQGQ